MSTRRITLISTAILAMSSVSSYGQEPAVATEDVSAQNAPAASASAEHVRHIRAHKKPKLDLNATSPDDLTKTSAKPGGSSAAGSTASNDAKKQGSAPKLKRVSDVAHAKAITKKVSAKAARPIERTPPARVTHERGLFDELFGDD